MAAIVFPDSEHVAVRWLQADTAVTATVGTDLLGWTAGTRRVVVTRVGGLPPLAQRVDGPRLDVDCYAENKAAAHDLAATVRASLHTLPTGDHTDLGAVVAHVYDDAGMQWLPDPDTTAARYIFTVRLAIHPHP